MGYMRHHAIIVTTYSKEYALSAYEKACEIYPTPITRARWSDCISTLQPSFTNGYWSFAIFPDGSQEGWVDSDAGDEKRERFKSWLRAQYHEDGSSSISWVEVQYGDENRETRVVASSDDDHAESDVLTEGRDDPPGMATMRAVGETLASMAAVDGPKSSAEHPI